MQKGSLPALLGRSIAGTVGILCNFYAIDNMNISDASILNKLANRFSNKDVLLSLMCQYTPDFATNCPYSNLHRKVTTFEYQSVLDTAAKLGFSGFSQAASSATAAFTPQFFNE